jgi:hypothetical protein
MHWRPEMQNEYAIQKGDPQRPGQAPDACWRTRMYTGYFPTTGAELLEIMRAIGGGVLSPQLQKMAEIGGQVFANRSFLVGISLREQLDRSKMPTDLATMADMMKLVDALVADMVLIWAPGQGVSVHDMIITGQIDPATMQALVAGLMPGGVEDLLGTLPGLLPTLLPGLFPGTQGFGASVTPENIAAYATSHMAVSRSAPGEPLATGLAITDQQGSSLPKAAPDGVDPVDPAGISGPGGIYLALGALALGVGLYIQGRKTR